MFIDSVQECTSTDKKWILALVCRWLLLQNPVTYIAKELLHTSHNQLYYGTSLTICYCCFSSSVELKVELLDILWKAQG